ncbi:4-hydroxy-3-methylbut-2-enyl diphosphate reductase [Clostridium formicaceticum]|uniref:4-hydroxy-3-methylbut-2-enyl diphosphate reductase n=1 Tax=Clostridium formicaceticum TaxID=1497 RepID=A0AAC9RLZ1_9CLOT|nr:4-hydroxy-3-methylbut-2-enyl diphosphate reductase [Clostridium formicaceticum]AOY77242.1 4-hydroxy-3-methylbut-2-enyl diphosphate reductase [Clostridium formicaceticum]ARE87775.1 4-hydroxy-3-methylbut-2-enyl diphosphate reductase [Clostridium formicaceticum]
MKVILADYSGFCFGVEKAIVTTFEELDKEDKNQKIFSLGPLIHNVQVVKELEARGVDVIEDIELVSEGSVIVRSHGVPKKIYEAADRKALTLIDATCPFVKRIQTIVEDHYKEGYTIVIIGNPQHPEVVGINGWCDNKALIIQEEEEVKKLPNIEKLCIVVQTTMSISQFEKIAAALEKKAKEVVKFNTICSATKQRQKSAKDLAQKVDAMIVIGGYHSSNTQKLVSICNDIRPTATFHVETAKDLPVEELKQYDLVGVTAGASTPKWIITEIIQKLRNI